ncbi:hypothetical protein VO63_30925 [Streptomyces showdoensis]|uniref:Uncharacterized protein n=1 Tax=Streptomyces showdoensis TaxID=68268 RepID=A0A2P2GF12_STREW|nr:hypothetical protein VO63_30925 [Streptomyces showdoensis]
MGAPLPPAERGDVDRIAGAAGAALGAAGYAAGFEEGVRLTAPDAVRRVREALDWPPDPVGGA